jgi:hypothetical protein
LFALVLVQLSVVLSPSKMLVGLALNVTVALGEDAALDSPGNETRRTMRTRMVSGLCPNRNFHPELRHACGQYRCSDSSGPRRVSHKQTLCGFITRILPKLVFHPW